MSLTVSEGKTCCRLLMVALLGEMEGDSCGAIASGTEVVLRGGG